MSLISKACETRSCSYSDGGRTCGVTKEWYGFNIDYYGLNFWVSITDVEVSKAEMEAL